ncbi:hemerythrin domain-containing protein [Streptacidiphilus jiangxiensis]|uniref:Hemerythrin HHE cation binding domain-containing protein n=1 Tax=Streptacidiphilus jiangxiensis TaxID=235985 RepID=A0A1H7H775_STRJI|nr:hemerythrin domain-containing protein [Streptacidiphilus jiangxiensis]SEK45142.1 Hemerythrin HHE cation binding domain-containing protein [Streptacidiphilus jiangxiensis]
MVQVVNGIDELKADHREVQATFDRINTLAPGDPQRREVVDEFTIELVQHAMAEEMYLYPAVREHVPEGNAMADREIEDHARVEDLLKHLEGMDADHPDFDALVSRVIADVSTHIYDEETHLFPALAAASTTAVLSELGEKIRSAKATSPTRPHPSVPGTPPMNKLLAPGLGLVDRARDLLSGRGRS